MNNYVSSVVRTWVPLGVGALITWLSANLGFVIDESSQVGLTVGFTAFVVGLYYAIIRKLEVSFPQIGWLLGLAKAPGYSVGDPPAPAPGPNPDAGTTNLEAGLLVGLATFGLTCLLLIVT